jgi:hypothetical protein
MVQQEHKTLDDTVSPKKNKTTRRAKCFDNKHFLIHQLVTQISDANSKGIEQPIVICILQYLGALQIKFDLEKQFKKNIVLLPP